MKTEITINLNGAEAKAILDGLLEIGYQAGKECDEEESRLIEAEMDENDASMAMCRARLERQRARKNAAYRAYDIAKREFARTGLVF